MNRCNSEMSHMETDEQTLSLHFMARLLARKKLPDDPTFIHRLIYVYGSVPKKSLGWLFLEIMV